MAQTESHDCDWCDLPATHVLIAREDRSGRDYACQIHTDEYRDGYERVRPVASPDIANRPSR